MKKVVSTWERKDNHFLCVKNTQCNLSVACIEYLTQACHFFLQVILKTTLRKESLLLFIQRNQRRNTCTGPQRKLVTVLGFGET